QPRGHQAQWLDGHAAIGRGSKTPAGAAQLEPLEDLVGRLAHAPRLRERPAHHGRAALGVVEGQEGAAEGMTRGGKVASVRGRGRRADGLRRREWSRRGRWDRCRDRWGRGGRRRRDRGRGGPACKATGTGWPGRCKITIFTAAGHTNW